MIDILEIATNADIVINGYAFTKDSTIIKVLNLNHPDKASVINDKGIIIETTMDDIEISIVLDYFNKNKKYMENKYA